MRRALVSLVMTAFLLVGCAADSDTPPQPKDPVKMPAPAEDEQPFRLLTHCGLSYPLEFDDHFWLPVDPEFRQTHNPPEGFGGDENYDEGTIQRVDDDTLIYTSSTGIEVEYTPTDKQPGRCE